MRFEWDPAKDRTNRRKHEVAFSEVTALFRDSDQVLEIYDADHSDAEERFISIGPIPRGIVVVVWTERIEDVIRIISARFATKRELELYQRRIGAIR